MMSTYLPSLFGENLMDMFDDFDRDFARAFSRPEHALYGKNAGRIMKTDVKETDDGYQVDIDLPGFKKEDIHLDLTSGYLTISAEKTLSKDQEGNGKVLRQERYAGSMQRSFYVGNTLTEEDIKAKYENGVLSLIVPKKEPELPQKKQILIE